MKVLKEILCAVSFSYCYGIIIYLRMGRNFFMEVVTIVRKNCISLSLSLQLCVDFDRKPSLPVLSRVANENVFLQCVIVV